MALALEGEHRVRTLIIDNYDSFTWNLYQMIAEVSGEPPLVVRNDQESWHTLRERAFDNIVISPGPGRPDREADFGACRQALLEAEVPVLGVCLGHQGLGHLHGGVIRHAPEPMHGRLSRVYHDGSALFRGLPQPFMAVRYHSLMIAPELPDALERIAWTEDGLVMGLRHRDRPLWGVQFHPESICTEWGRELLRNFQEMTQARRRPPRPGSASPPAEQVRKEPPGAQRVEAAFRLRSRRLELEVDAERVFVHCFGDAPYAFWLDSSLVRPGLSRFSFMGKGGGPQSRVIRYDAETRTLLEERAGVVSQTTQDLFDYLDRALEARRCVSPELPFEFNCGFVGYLGYELRAALGFEVHQPSPLPDAVLMLADRVVAFDHEEGQVYLLCLSQPGEERLAEAWFDEMEGRLRSLPPLEPPVLGSSSEPVVFRLARSRERYLSDIACCLEQIREGESYEVCLTNKILTEARLDPLLLHRVLRAMNPAPFAAFLRLGESAVVSSSPERFLKVDATGRVEAKPIKGTAPRGQTAEEDAGLQEWLRAGEKSRAENLMIVDLLRNDLGSVCAVGSVQVPRLMDVETYASVHQLVSTITGRLAEGRRAKDVVRAAFPGGSMTGAPKRRTMEIIERLEGEARGVYSGAIGFFGLSGAADLNIVIRSAVITASGVSIGTGGAIVALSRPEEEYEETLLKARSLLRAIVTALHGAFEPGRLVLEGS